MKDRVVGGKVTDNEKNVVVWAARAADVTVSKFVADAALDRALEQLSHSPPLEATAGKGPKQ